ncbi:hypothetical protein [Streptomyces millisiae]|uniref:Baseplate protein J-like domain-containing protein n=1 Tax=Streptomyces millisiae TaxID=3075542 RepID=A0ABU2LJ67_9ACTN|nr:hypothetical protein [Streptomyces sp. DSM 44918]MDT0317614.1 hypothetical protein [Streptomyces sp. DSM 44918]
MPNANPVQDIQWIALPAGLGEQDGRPRLSVFVAPRLRPERAATLREFPDFLTWADRMTRATFQLVVTDTEGNPLGGPFDTTPDFGDTPPDQALWGRFFSEATPVEPHTPDDHTSQVYVSYPAREVARDNRVEFARVAGAAPRGLPTASQMAGVSRTSDEGGPGELRVLTTGGGADDSEMMTADALHASDERIDTALADARAKAAQARDRHTSALAGGEVDLQPRFITLSGLNRRDQHRAFHRPARPASSTPIPPRPVEQPEKVDFHRMLSALGDHPFLLRRLGLVLDLLLPADAITPDGPGERCLRVLPTFASDGPAEATRNIRPGTAFVFRQDPGLFAAAGRDIPEGPLTRGLLALPDEEFSLEQSDIDSTALKTITAKVATTAVMATGQDATGPAAPALRTKGLVLVHRDRAASLHDQLARSVTNEARLNAAADPFVLLHAEDLVRGHRLDVLDDTRGKWCSLHQRDVTYRGRDHDDVIATHTDEGFFQDSLVSHPEQPDVVALHEHLVTWDGWSRSAPRPGRVLPAAAGGRTGAEGTGEVTAVDDKPATDLPLRIEAAVHPGSLPRLRFGHGYQVRVRTVDLAGNGLTLDQADTLVKASGPGEGEGQLVQPKAGPVVFQRFDPVPPPTVVPRFRFNEAESEHRMVIRSVVDQSPEEFATRFNDAHRHHEPYRGVDERHLVAPRASLECVERHGMLDQDMSSQDPAVRRRAYELAIRESGRLDDERLPGVEIVTPDAGQRSRRYAVHTGEQAVTPHLPDPTATGVLVFDLPGAAGGLPIGWDGPTWHEPRSLRLRLVEGEGEHRFDPDERVLTVPLPKAATRTLRVCSRLDMAAVQPILGAVELCRRGLEEDEPDAQDGRDRQAEMTAIREAVAANQHWMVTPWQEITLVHAVQQPLAPPRLDFGDGTERQEYETAAYLSGTVDLHADSTERIDLLAEWTEQIDDGKEENLPGPQSRSSAVWHIPLALAREFALTDAPPGGFPCRLDGDRLTFDARAAEAFTRDGRPNTPPVPARHEFGDTKHRVIAYRAVAASAFADCFPATLTDEDPEAFLTRGEKVEHVVRSSARPAAPNLLYCMPTIRFEDVEAEAGTTVRRRRGGGLRIYLARPWFSSGDGELLGVLLHEGTGDPPENVLPFVTLLGRDPIHDSTAVSHPSAATFPGAARTDPGVSLHGPGVPEGLKVTVVGYAPKFDPDSNRWYCDLDIDAGNAYLPFARLALARYQPNALERHHLSPVVRTELVRVLPQRLLTVVHPRSDDGQRPGRFREFMGRFGRHDHDDHDHDRHEGHEHRPGPVSVRVEGPSYKPGPNGAPRVVAVLERRDPDVPDDALGWAEIPESRVELTREDTATGTVFSGEVPPAGDGGPIRLMVCETEGLRPDSEAESSDPAERRVIYTDVVPLGFRPGGPPEPDDHRHDDGPHGPHEGPPGGPHEGPHRSPMHPFGGRGGGGGRGGRGGRGGGRGRGGR